MMELFIYNGCKTFDADAMKLLQSALGGNRLWIAATSQQSRLFYVGGSSEDIAACSDISDLVSIDTFKKSGGVLSEEEERWVSALNLVQKASSLGLGRGASPA